VIFTSDNGPVYDDGYMDGTVVRTSTAEVDQGHDGSGPWRGGKYQIYEGGTRVPFVVRWPGRVEPGVSDALVTQTDLLASFAALFDVPLPEGQARDSRDQLPALLGDDPLGAPFIVEEAGRLALRRGPWKYVAPRAGVASGYDGAELYDLATDPRETVNLIARRPVMAGELRALLARIVASEGGLRALDD
jgi:arylsulfatase A